MDTTIIETTPADLFDLLSNNAVFYIKDLLFSVSLRFSTWDAKLQIQDISSALKRGKTCTVFTIYFKNDAVNDSTGLNRMLTHLAGFGKGAEALKAAFAFYLSRNWVTGRFGGIDPLSFDEKTEAHRTDEAAVRVYSPFAEVAPLGELPKKWTVAHVVRCLWNGQYKELRCRGVYTDDYAYDAAANFQRGPISNGRAFAKQLIESPSGWWAHQSGNEVSICCHSFDSNSFVPVLRAA